MYNTLWIERPAHSQNEQTPEEAALRETYIAAQKIAFSLVCASNQLSRCVSPDVTACAALVREAVHKPEKDRANAVKIAEQAVLERQLDYVSTLAYYLQHAEAWQSLRPTLVAQLEVVALPKEESSRWTTPYVDVDLFLNCEAVAGLIDECDIAINEAMKRHHYSRPTQKHAEAVFQKVFDALAAEVAGQNWMFNARLSCRAAHSTDILRDLPLEKISSTHLPAQFEKCSALDSAREEFERVFSYNLTTACRDFQQNTRGTFNDTQLSESLLQAMPNIEEMQRVEERRDTKLRTFGRSWRSVRNLVDRSQALFVRVAELLPEAVAEAAAIEDEKARRQAQNLCLFAARRLKENLKYIRECDRWIGDRDENLREVSGAIERGHQALVKRIRSKEIHRPSNQCRPEPYCG